MPLAHRPGTSRSQRGADQSEVGRVLRPSAVAPDSCITPRNPRPLQHTASQRAGAQEGWFVAIDIETGAYEIDANEIVASDRLRLRHPEALIWLRQIGSRYARRFGP